MKPLFAFAFGPIEIIVIVLVAAFVIGKLSRRSRPRQHSSVAGWFFLFGLVMFGLLFFGIFTARVVHVPQPIEVVTQLPQASMMQTTITREVEPTEPPQAAKTTDSIEEMWKQLTAPRINLEETVVEESVSVVNEAIGPSSPQELTQAAKVILSASVPGADPFTQGWLVNAAKSILDGRAVPPPPAAPAAPAEPVKVTQKIQEDPFAALPQNAPQPPVKHPNPFAEERFVEQAKSLPKPDWVINPPKQVGNVRKVIVTSGPFSTVDECQSDLDRKMHDVVLNRMTNFSQSSIARRTSNATLDEMGLGGDYIRRELCTDEFVDTLDSSVGEMKQVYALLEFNETQDAMLVDRARSYSRREGLQSVSLIGGGLLASVATLFGLLKVDTWTRGYYTKRLFLGVPAAIITVLALLFVS
ncbi:hypothetical protein [Lacipirellula parvula]|uniref:Uncharacterized protein n=1 Tax=Lacipirellula parvula TaxID=2650471 RepID=A0A5K7X544_9BACT|nr:hypothetical protein [Lacipirellula parvula]BBO31515.1 hypothetical protein PLANPX_1127 [Lacipirellula parvula]